MLDTPAGLSARQPVALTIAGSDSGAGAGIQADLKTFAAHGVYGVSVVTLVTAQSTQGVKYLEVQSSASVAMQLDTVTQDFDIRCAKTGALGESALIHRVYELFRGASIPLVVDPVMISKHGHRLIDDEAIDTLKDTLSKVARLVTPNLHEAAELSGLPLATSREEMLATAEELGRLGWRACVVKGGHLEGNPADLLWDDGAAVWLEGERIDTPHLHGTGCTFSAAITANLVRGLELEEAVRDAKAYTAGAIRHGQRFGHGVNPVNHFWRTQPEFGRIES